MSVPGEFEYLVKCFYQGSRDEYATDEEWIVGTLSFLSSGQKLVVRRFIDELLGGSYSDTEIGQIWRRPGPCVDFSTGGHRFFLRQIGDVIARRSS